MLKTLAAKGERFHSIALPRGRVGLKTMPTAAGLERRTSPTYAWDGLKRGKTPFVVVQHTIAGRGRLSCDGRTHELTPGTTMLVRVPHRHRYFLPPGGNWSFFFMVLAGGEAVRLATEIAATAGPVLRLPAAIIDDLADICDRLIAERDLTPGSASALAYGALMLLLDQAQPGAQIETDARPDWLGITLAHIESNLAAPLPVEHLAEIARLSRAHFVRQFTRHVGEAPSDFVFRQRMEHAARLLQTTPDPVVEIAARCGFSQPNYFSKAFRRAFDVSPSEFRASGMYMLAPHGSRS